MKKEISSCDSSKIACLVLVRYQNIGEQTKGCLFLGNNYICDTLEGCDYQGIGDDKNYAIPSGIYHLAKRRLKRVSLGSGFYRSGETRLYIKRWGITYGMFSSDVLRAKNCNIGVGFRATPHTDVGMQPLMQSDMTRTFLSSVFGHLDYVYFWVVYAREKDILELTSSPAFLAQFTLTDYQKDELSILQSLFWDNKNLPTFESLRQIANLK